MKNVSPMLKYVARLLVGILFLLSSFGKLAGTEAFGNLITSYGFPWLSILAPAIAALELAAGLALVLDVFPRIAVPVTLGLLLVFTGAFFYGNVVHGVQDCGCFGNLDFMKMPAWATYLRNVLLLGLLLLGWDSRKEKPSAVAVGIWVLGVAAGLFFSGYTFTLPQHYQDRVSSKHPLIGTNIQGTPLSQFVQTSPDSTYTLFVFSYSCTACVNSMPNMMEYQDPAICDKVIGLTVSPDEDGVGSYYHFPFQLIPVGDALGHFTHTIPTLLYIQDNKIKFIIEGRIPSSYWFRSFYLENL